MSDPSTTPSSPTSETAGFHSHHQQLEENSNSLINLNGWGLVGSEKENLPMNEHQTGYLTNMYASEVMPRLYLGSKMASSDKAWLSDHNITHILTIANDIPPLYPESYEYKVIEIHDYTTEDIMKHFDDTYDFIQQALEKQGNILVHCQAGISRSSTVVIAYIMKSRNVSFDNAMEFVKEKRPVIFPNSGFRKQLRLYETMGYQVTKKSPKYWGYLAKRWSRRILIPETRVILD